jgi:hypothetical protein
LSTPVILISDFVRDGDRIVKMLIYVEGWVSNADREKVSGGEVEKGLILEQAESKIDVATHHRDICAKVPSIYGRLMDELGQGC